MRIRALLVAALTLALVVTTSACGGESGDGGTTSAASATRTTEEQNLDGTLTVALSGDITDFDPHTNALVVYGSAIRRTVFSSLVRYDEKMELQADLADSWEASPDATTYTFQLNPDARFSDGTPVDAAAVVASLERVAEQESALAERVAGVESYEVLGDNELQIKLRAPDAAFLDGLTDIAIVPRSNFADVRRAPVGSGPFTMKEWVANDRIVLERNEDYWGEAPKVQSIVFKPIPDQQVALSSLKSGRIDAIAEPPANMLDETSGGLQVIEPDNPLSVVMLELGVKRGKLGDVRVRRALAHALDKDSIRKIAYRDRGSEPFWTPTPRGSWAFDEVEGYPYDLEQARALLEEAGAEDLSFTLTLLAGFPEAQETARIWQQSLREIGVDMKIEVDELSVWLDKYNSRDFEAIWNFYAASGDPNLFYSAMWPQIKNGGFENADIDRLAREAVSTADVEERTALYHELDGTFVDELPVIVVQSRPVGVIASDEVSDLKVDGRGMLVLTDVSR